MSDEETIAFSLKISDNELDVPEDMSEEDFFQTLTTYLPEVNRAWWIRLLKNKGLKNKSMKPKWSTLMKFMTSMKNIDVNEMCSDMDETLNNEVDKNNETVYFDSKDNEKPNEETEKPQPKSKKVVTFGRTAPPTGGNEMADVIKSFMDHQSNMFSKTMDQFSKILNSQGRDRSISAPDPVTSNAEEFSEYIGQEILNVSNRSYTQFKKIHPWSSQLAWVGCSKKLKDIGPLDDLMVMKAIMRWAAIDNTAEYEKQKRMLLYACTRAPDIVRGEEKTEYSLLKKLVELVDNGFCSSLGGIPPTAAQIDQFANDFRHCPGGQLGRYSFQTSNNSKSKGPVDKKQFSCHGFQKNECNRTNCPFGHFCQECFVTQRKKLFHVPSEQCKRNRSNSGTQ